MLYTIIAIAIGLIIINAIKKRGDKQVAGTAAGGKAAASTNKTRYGEDFYARIGAIGGKKGRTGGFFANRELARTAGAKGGRKSRRGKAVA